jgi:hypothetical protein
MGSFPVSDLGRLVIFVNKRRLLTEGIDSCILTAHNGLPKYRHIHLMSLLHLLQLAHGQRDFTSSLHSAMVTSRKPMVHWDCYIAPTASRPAACWTSNLDLASPARFHAPFASPPVTGLHPVSCTEKIQAMAQKRRRSLHQTTPRSRVRTMSGLLTRNHVAAKLSCRNMYRSLRANYCVVLNHSVHPRSLVLYADACVPATPAYV